MNRIAFCCLAASCGLILPTVNAGPSGKAPVVPPPPAFDFSGARRPITNPTLFDLPLAQTQIHPIVAYHRLPSAVSTILGDLPVGGDAWVFAVQAEYAFTDTLSLIATKDGYIDLNPDETLSDEAGWANLAAGLKWTALVKPEKKMAAALSLVFEAPSGDRSVFQGEGDGTFVPAISAVWMPGKFQVNDTLGFRLPIDTDAESTFFYYSLHVDYAVTDKFFPTLELNWFHVLDDGDGGNRYSDQVGGLVPAAVRFEGGDLFNLGASNASDNSDFVSLGIGFRYRILENLDFGLAYELPLTEDEEGLMKDRFTADLVWRF